MDKTIQTISFIGSGNVATNLALAFKEKGLSIKQVISKTKASAALLASKVGCSYHDNIFEVDRDIDLLIVSVTDSQIEPVLSGLPDLSDTIVAHTAGSVSIDVLANVCRNAAVIYPLQTMQKEVPTKLQLAPIFIEANNDATRNSIEQLAGSISGMVYECDSADRARLHIAAVFACNFSNCMLACAEQMMTMNELDFNLLLPLVNETFHKAFRSSPYQNQTGPARRGDVKIISKHLEILKDNPDLLNLYSFVSQYIMDKYKE